MVSFKLKDYYEKYLREIRKVSDRSVEHYIDAINWISRYLVRKGLLSESLFEVLDTEKIEYLAAIPLSDPEFVAMDKRGHQMYTAGLNNYLRFVRGEKFEKIGKQVELLDMPVAVSTMKDKATTSIWSRSGVIKEQSIILAKYECEVDRSHKTFISARSGQPFMEGHHTIPLKYQADFSTSLDVYANIVCVCPICHRFLHFGKNTDKLPTLNKIYYERSDRLAKSGIRLSREEFIQFSS